MGPPYLKLQALRMWLPDEKGGVLLPDGGCRLGNSLLEMRNWSVGEQSSMLFPLTLSSKGSPLQGIFSYLGFMGSLSHGESSIRVGGLGAFSELKGQDQS